MTGAYYRISIGKGKEQTLASGSGFLVSKGVPCGGVCFLAMQSGGAPGSIWDRAWECSEA